MDRGTNVAGICAQKRAPFIPGAVLNGPVDTGPLVNIKASNRGGRDALPTLPVMPDNPLNAVNRGVYISDNLPFLRRLNDGCIDLVCIDPPFAKNETFGRKKDDDPDPLKPEMDADEKRIEEGLLKRWGINTPDEATAAGIDWPETAYKDFWSWEKDVHDDWLTKIEVEYPSVSKLIDVTRDIHSEDTAAYLCYMAVRLFEIRRVLKDTGSLYLHCDHTAGAYLRQLLDGISGTDETGNRVSKTRSLGEEPQPLKAQRRSSE